MSTLQAPVQFCSNCKNLLLDSSTCGRCNTVNELIDREMVIEKKYPGSKMWSQKIIKVQKARMKIDCPNCGATKMSYTSRQMRSADEGETVFLECESCGYKSVI